MRVDLYNNERREANLLRLQWHKFGWQMQVHTETVSLAAH